MVVQRVARQKLFITRGTKEFSCLKSLQQQRARGRKERRVVVVVIVIVIIVEILIAETV